MSGPVRVIQMDLRLTQEQPLVKLLDIWMEQRLRLSMTLSLVVGKVLQKDSLMEQPWHSVLAQPWSSVWG